MFSSYNYSFKECRKVNRVIGALKGLSKKDNIFKELVDDFNNSNTKEKDFKAKALINLFDNWVEEGKYISLEDYVFFVAIA